MGAGDSGVNEYLAASVELGAHIEHFVQHHIIRIVFFLILGSQIYRVMQTVRRGL